MASRALTHVAGPWRYRPVDGNILDTTSCTDFLLLAFPALGRDDASRFVSNARVHASTALNALATMHRDIPLFRADVDIFLGLSPGASKKFSGSQSDAPTQVMLPLILLDILLGFAHPNPPAIRTPCSGERPSLGPRRLDEVYPSKLIPLALQLISSTEINPSII